MRHRSIRVAAAVATAALLATIAGCASSTPAASPSSASGHRAGYRAVDAKVLPADWNKVENAAVKEGAVTIYTSTPPAQIQPIIADFNKIYPEVKVTLVSDTLSTLIARYEQEHNSGAKTADVLESSGFEPLIAAHPTWIKNLYKDPSYLPELKNYPKSVLPKSRPHSATVGAYTWQIAYNSNLIKAADAPKTFKDLDSSKYKGKIGIVDPRNSDIYASIYMSLGQMYGQGWLTKLMANNPTLLTDSTGSAQQVGSGALEIAFPTNQSKAASYIASGAPLKLADVTPWPLGATTLSVPTNAPHPAAAQLFSNFLMTSQAQEKECGLIQVGSLNPKAKGACSQYSINSGATVIPLSLTADQRTKLFAQMGLH